MNQSLAIWVLVVLGLVTANLPFVMQRPFLALPWSLAGEPARPWWLRVLESLLFFALLIGLGWLTHDLIGSALVMGGDVVSAAVFLGKLVVVIGLAVLLLAYPGWRTQGVQVHKTFFVRLLEVLVFYGLIGVLGFAFELNIGNPFPQTWEFYAITLSLYLVLAYPGFVFRYLLRRR